MPFALPPGGFPAPVHTLFEVGAVLAGARLYATLRSRAPDPVGDDRRQVVLIGAAVGALVGSRALAALEHPDLFAGASALHVAALLLGLKTIVGGLLGGLVGVEATKWLVGERRRTGDLFVFPVLLAIAVGRVGCFLAGVKDSTAGAVTAVPWAIDQGDGLPRHPTALYEIAFLAVLALLLLRIEVRRAREGRALPSGALFALFLSGYLAWRLGVEFLKPVDPVVFGLSAIQLACVMGLLHYARLALLGRYSRHTEAAGHAAVSP